MKMSEIKELNTRGKKNIVLLITIIPLLIIVFLGLYYLYFRNHTLEERGTFGDMFGAANALFSGLALAGIIISIRMQSRELELQREELTETRKELKRSASAQEKSERALTKQLESMQMTARLNALNTLINFNIKNADILAQESPFAYGKMAKLNDVYLSEIEDILTKLRDK